MHASKALLLLSLLTPALPACLTEIGPDTCDRSLKGNPPVAYTEGSVDNGVYMTSGWDEELLYFPGGMRYTLIHELGETPRFWQAYLSFNQTGTKNTSSDPEDPERGTLALAAGNQVELTEANETSLTVVNGSCVDYWLLVVASTGALASGAEP